MNGCEQHFVQWSGYFGKIGFTSWVWHCFKARFGFILKSPPSHVANWLKRTHAVFVLQEMRGDSKPLPRILGMPHYMAPREHPRASHTRDMGGSPGQLRPRDSARADPKSEDRGSWNWGPGKRAPLTSLAHLPLSPSHLNKVYWLTDWLASNLGRQILHLKTASDFPHSTLFISYLYVSAPLVSFFFFFLL